MLKIHQIFILKFVGLLVATLLVSSLISYISLKSTIIDNNKIHLQHAISLIELNLNDIDDLDSYVQKVAKSTGLRMTVVNDEGIVIAESNFNKNDMDNHANRYEIMKSNKETFAHIVRYSNTLKVDFLYVAKKILYKGKKVYLRLSMDLGQIMSEFYALWSKLITAFVIIFLIAFYISKKMSERIVYDINQITKYLDEISNKNYKAVIKTKYFYEFLQISLMLKNLVKKLSNREKQKQKYTAKLRLMNKQRNDILSAISHEFKNPIASIVGYAQTLQEDHDIDVRIREKFLGKINANGEKISKMLDRLALSVKLENRDIEINPSEFDLKTMCEEIATNLMSKYKGRYVEVDLKPTILNADKTMIDLVIVNLVDNALKYSHDDVKITLQNGSIVVEDKGIGIQEEYLDKVTSKFYRVKKNTWDNSMGIGLALVSYILKAHNSSLKIDSTFGKGSSFSFSLKKMIKK